MHFSCTEIFFFFFLIITLNLQSRINVKRQQSILPVFGTARKVWKSLYWITHVMMRALVCRGLSLISTALNMCVHVRCSAHAGMKGSLSCWKQVSTHVLPCQRKHVGRFSVTLVNQSTLMHDRNRASTLPQFFTVTKLTKFLNGELILTQTAVFSKSQLKTHSVILSKPNHVVVGNHFKKVWFLTFNYLK